MMEELLVEKTEFNDDSSLLSTKIYKPDRVD